ncbi:MAG: hypothetical protein U0X93_03945 [Anaerolineales bacterium]
MKAMMNGKTIWIGNQKLMNEAGVALSSELTHAPSKRCKDKARV